MKTISQIFEMVTRLIAETAKLEQAIKANLRGLGHGK